MFAALGRIYGFRHLLSLERIRYYIQVSDKCQYLNIISVIFSPRHARGENTETCAPLGRTHQ